MLLANHRTMLEPLPQNNDSQRANRCRINSKIGVIIRLDMSNKRRTKLNKTQLIAF